MLLMEEKNGEENFYTEKRNFLKEKYGNFWRENRKYGIVIEEIFKIGQIENIFFCRTKYIKVLQHLNHNKLKKNI